jgi:ribosome-associated translation inhibitor RaiA
MATAQAHVSAGDPKTGRSDWDVAVQLTVNGRGNKTTVERVLRRKIAWLRRHFPEIRSCRVAVDVPHRHPHRGRLHRVRIGIVLHGTGGVRATHSPSLATHEDALVAIHDAFAAVHRELAERAHRHEERRRVR